MILWSTLEMGGTFSIDSETISLLSSPSSYFVSSSSMISFSSLRTLPCSTICCINWLGELDCTCWF
jgi:hypothetical protein